jgi:hypothetical protein
MSELYRKSDDMSDEELEAAGARLGHDLVNMMATAILHAADIIGGLHRRGLRKPKLPAYTEDVLLRVDAGQLDAKLAGRYYLSPILRRLQFLPLPVQQQLAETGKVEVAVLREDGQSDHRLLSVDELGPEQFRRVFTRDKVRSVSEQLRILDQERIDEQKKREQDAELLNDAFVLPCTSKQKRQLTKLLAKQGAVVLVDAILENF